MTQQLPLYQIPMPQPNFIDNPVLTPSQQNELQPIANNLIASRPQQNYNLPPLQPQLQPDNTVPSFVNNPNLSVQQKQAMLNAQTQPQVVDVAPQSQSQPVMGNAGAQRRGVDWAGLLGNLGSYMAAAGSAYGTGANPSQGLLNATNATRKLTQDIQQYDTMKPYYQQMGYDVSRFDPRRGGAGVASTPESMINLQSQVDQRNMNNLYRQQMIEAMQQKQQGTQGGKVLTVGQLMMLSPEFKARMQGQYDFSGGQNADLLNQQIPTSLLQGYMPAKKTNITYGGGVTSRQVKSGRSDIYHHSNGGSRSNKRPGVSLIIK